MLRCESKGISDRIPHHVSAIGENEFDSWRQSELLDWFLETSRHSCNCLQSFSVSLVHEVQQFTFLLVFFQTVFLSVATKRVLTMREVGAQIGQAHMAK